LREGLAHYLATGESNILGRRTEMTARRADGTEFPVELAITPVKLNGATIFTAYVRDIVAQKEAKEQLERHAADLARSNAELERSNCDLDDFAYIASHDLKEPLRGIHNFSHFLLEDHGEKLGGEGR